VPIKDGNLNKVNALLKTGIFGQGADANTVDSEGNSLHFIIAAQKGNLAIVDALLSHGATLDSLNNVGLTPLFYAGARKGMLPVVGDSWT
jgi:ankyrin repeat protein